MTRCIALLSGGLDSILAIRLMQEQDIEVEALTFRTIFTCCQDQAGRAAQKLGIPLTAISPDPDYLQVVRKPQFGYGRGANPCVDCRIYMFQLARRFAEQQDADFVISGEIVGQRPMSQKRRDLEVISHHSELDDRLLRPLCARRLPPTWPEREGLVDRGQLHAFSGRSRKGLIRLAAKLGITDIPSPSTGCALTEPRFSRKVFDLMDHDRSNDLWAFESLKYGRHFRLGPTVKLIVGRHEADNLALKEMHERHGRPAATLMTPHNFPGPSVLVVGSGDESHIQAALGMMIRYGRPSSTQHPLVNVRRDDRTEQRPAQSATDVSALCNIATGVGA